MVLNKSVGVWFCWFFFSFPSQKITATPLVKIFTFPLPEKSSSFPPVPPHHVRSVPLLSPMPPGWHASRAEGFYIFFYYFLFYFHRTFRLQLPKLFDLPRCLLTRKKTLARSAGSSAHTWAPWRASMLLPNLVTQRARGGRGGGMKGAAGGTSKPLPPRPAPALPYIGGAGGGRRFPCECVSPPPAPLISPWGASSLGAPFSPITPAETLRGSPRCSERWCSVRPGSGGTFPVSVPSPGEPGWPGSTEVRSLTTLGKKKG